MSVGFEHLFVLGFWPVLAAGQIPEPGDAPEPRPPEEGAAAFSVPDGFRVELVASEPLVASPSGLCWGADGSMFASELHGYNLEGQLDVDELNKTGELDTEVRRVQAGERFKEAAKAGTFGVVKRLRDTDGDGRMDVADVLADDLPPAYGLVPFRGGVIVACAPDIVYLADRDGDGRAEEREVLFTGFRTGVLERGVNAPRWGDDGWVYFGRGAGGGTITGPRLAAPVALPDSDFRALPDGTAIEPVTGGTHTFGFALTLAGDRFVATTSVPAVYVAPLPWRYLVRNPDTAAGDLTVSSGDRRARAVAPPHPWRQRRADHPEYSDFYRSRYGAAESEASGWFTSACGPLVFRDGGMPGLRGKYLVCEPAGNFIHRAELGRDGPGLQVSRDPLDGGREFVASADPWCHPIFLSHGPDGALWVVDYYREIIEDYSAIPRHLQQQYGVYRGHDRGRVYRITHRDLPVAPAAAMGGLATPALVAETASPLLWRRQTAARLLAERGDRSAVELLREALAAGAVGEGTEEDAETVVTALLTLDRLGALAPGDVVPFFAHRDPAVRVSALQLGDRWFAVDDRLLGSALAAAEREQDPRVLLQFALSLGESRDPRAFAELVRLAREHGAVRWMEAAVLSSLHGRGAELLGAVVSDPGQASGWFQAISEMIVARGDAAELALALSLAAGAPEAVRAGLVETLSMSSSKAISAGAGGPVGSEAGGVEVSPETLDRYIAALSGPRDRERGREVFLAACASCHRVGGDGHDFGPDLLGEIGFPEETLVRHLLVPAERIRPGFETVLVEFRDGTLAAGVVTDDGATAVSLAMPGGRSRVVLRKDIASTSRLAVSLMPSFAGTLTPEDMAHLLAWLKSLGGESR